MYTNFFPSVVALGMGVALVQGFVGLTPGPALVVGLAMIWTPIKANNSLFLFKPKLKFRGFFFFKLK